MTENEVLEYFKSSKRKNDMLGILPGSDIGNTIIKALEELKQYRTIGTVEECRAAVEKQEPFKPETAGPYIGIGRCKCGVEFLDRKTNYCGNCGQKLDWSTETVTEQEGMEARK